MPIEFLRLFVLGIHDECINGNLGPCGPVYCVPEQGSPELEAPAGKGDGQAPEARNGYGRIARQAFRKWVRHFSEWNAAGGQRVVSGNPTVCGIQQYETGRDAPALILASLVPKVSIERNDSAGKGGAIMTGGQSLHDERSRHRNDEIKREWAFLARFMAGARTGGFSSRSTKRCWSRCDNWIT
jgi:hypothetical protein